MAKRKTKLFISGPMTGIEHYNVSEFNRYADMARMLGYRVVNPVEMARKIGIKKILSDKRALKKLISDELVAVKDCDAILLLDGWQKSKGALDELRVAIGAHLEVKIQHDIEMEYLDFERKPFMAKETERGKKKGV